MQCSVQIDTISRESVHKNLEPFKYKGEIEIPARGMVDDILTISESGFKTARMNAFITANIAFKILQLGPNKYFVLHTGKDHEEYRNVEPFFNGWKLNSVEDVDTESDSREDTLTENMKIPHINSENTLDK